jgi:cardiolipin synthase
MDAFVRNHGKLQTGLIVTGAITVPAVIGGLFVAAGDSPDAVYADSEIAAVESDLFATSLSNLVNAPLGRGGAVTILNNGDEFIPSLIQAINSAQHTINFSVYIWTDGVVSEKVLNALVAAQKRNVAVRVLLDGYGSKNISDRKFRDLKEAGGRVEKFRTPQFGKLTRFHRRNHRRSIVIDGEVGFTGGMAVGDNWLGHAEDPDHWRDIMFKVTGAPARALQSAFVSPWVGSCGEILASSNMYPAGSDENTTGLKRFIHLVNSPTADDHSLAQFFLMSILAARQSLYIATPYFIPDRHLMATLQQKACSGVDVRLLLPGKHTDNGLVRMSSQSNYEDLLKAGARIYEYGPTFMHSKFLVVDHQWSIIGSPNLNTRSRRLDEENVFGIFDRRFGEQLVTVFFDDIKNAKEIQPDEWARRNVFLRVIQRLAQTFDKQS